MLRVLLLGSIVSPTVWAAVPVPAGSLLVRPAHFFDLGGKTVRFTPVASSYKVGTIPVQFRTERGEALGEADFVNPPLALGRREQPMVRSWRVKLPFESPFAGSNWSEIFVNSTGTLSLGRPDTELYNERNPWADGTMRAVAASMDVRAVAGAEQTIAPLWATCGSIPRHSRSGSGRRRHDSPFLSPDGPAGPANGLQRIDLLYLSIEIREPRVQCGAHRRANRVGIIELLGCHTQICRFPDSGAQS